MVGVFEYRIISRPVTGVAAVVVVIVMVVVVPGGGPGW